MCFISCNQKIIINNRNIGLKISMCGIIIYNMWSYSNKISFQSYSKLLNTTSNYIINMGASVGSYNSAIITLIITLHCKQSCKARRDQLVCRLMNILIETSSVIPIRFQVQLASRKCPHVIAGAHHVPR